MVANFTQQETQDKASPQDLELDDAIETLRRDKFKIPRALMDRMVNQESGGNDNAVSPLGARSRFQVMPATLAGIAKEAGKQLDPDNPLHAAYAGLYLLRQNYDRFRPKAKNDKHAWMMAVAGYHGSPDNVARDLDGGGLGIPDQGDGLINTQDHVYRIFAGTKPEDFMPEEGADNSTPEAQEDTAEFQLPNRTREDALESGVPRRREAAPLSPSSSLLENTQAKLTPMSTGEALAGTSPNRAGTVEIEPGDGMTLAAAYRTALRKLASGRGLSLSEAQDFADATLADAARRGVPLIRDRQSGAGWTQAQLQDYFKQGGRQIVIDDNLTIADLNRRLAAKYGDKTLGTSMGAADERDVRFMERVEANKNPLFEIPINPQESLKFDPRSSQVISQAGEELAALTNKFLANVSDLGAAFGEHRLSGHFRDESKLRSQAADAAESQIAPLSLGEKVVKGAIQTPLPVAQISLLSKAVGVPAAMALLTFAERADEEGGGKVFAAYKSALMGKSLEWTEKLGPTIDPFAQAAMGFAEVKASGGSTDDAIAAAIQQAALTGAPKGSGVPTRESLSVVKQPHYSKFQPREATGQFTAGKPVIPEVPVGTLSGVRVVKAQPQGTPEAGSVPVEGVPTRLSVKPTQEVTPNEINLTGESTEGGISGDAPLSKVPTRAQTRTGAAKHQTVILTEGTDRDGKFFYQWETPNEQPLSAAFPSREEAIGNAPSAETYRDVNKRLIKELDARREDVLASNIDLISARYNPRVDVLVDGRVKERSGVRLELSYNPEKFERLDINEVAKAFPSVDKLEIEGLQRFRNSFLGQDYFALNVGFKTEEAAQRALRDVEALTNGKTAMGKVFDAMSAVPEREVRQAEPKQLTTSEPTQSSVPTREQSAEWKQFPPDSGTLAVPRASMPQIKSEHRGAMVQFLKGRGITHAQEEVAPNTLKPTQAEFSPGKVDKARGFEGTPRSILVSADNYVVDGHHQWMASLTDAPAAPIPVIRLDAPIQQLLVEVARFPSSGVDKATVGATPGRTGTPLQEQSSVPTREGIVEMHGGLNPVAALRAADDLNVKSGSFTVDRGDRGGRDFHLLDKFRTPLSNLDFTGTLERIGGEPGRKASDAIREAQVSVSERFNEWKQAGDSIEAYLEQARTHEEAITATDSATTSVARKLKRAERPEKGQFYADFVDLVELPFNDPKRQTIKQAGGSMSKALEAHDNLTENWRKYVVNSRKELGIETPDDWGITEQGYFRHLFLGDINVFDDGNFIATAKTYAEAQKLALGILKEKPEANIVARARNVFAGDPTVRLSTKQFWKVVNNLHKSVEGEVELSKADILEDVRGVIGQNRSRQKFFGALLHRTGRAGYSKDYAAVMQMHAAQLARTQELSKLNQALTPLMEGFRREGKPGLAEELKSHLDDLWGTPSRMEKEIGNLIRQTPVLRNHVSNPDMAFRKTAQRVTSLQSILRLQFNPRAAIVNLFDPLTTLWPYVTTKDFASLYGEYLKPSTRQMLRERGVLEGATKLEGDTTFISAKRHIIPRPFEMASNVNRGLGYLYGLKDSGRLGLSGDEAHRYALDWAKKVEFDNSIWNAPPILRTPAGRVLGQFKGYTIKSLENLRTLAKGQEGDGSLSRTGRIAKYTTGKAAVGGLKSVTSPARVLFGIGGYGVVLALSDQFQQFGMDADGADYTAQALYYGAPALIGQDLSASVAVLDDFYGETPEEKIVNLLGGPTVGAGLTVYKGSVPVREELSKFRQDPSKAGALLVADEAKEAAGKVAPKLTPYARTADTIWQEATSGETSIKVGKNERIKLSNFEAVMRGLGFTPLKQSSKYDAKENTYDVDLPPELRLPVQRERRRLGMNLPTVNRSFQQDGKEVELSDEQYADYKQRLLTEQHLRETQMYETSAYKLMRDEAKRERIKALREELGNRILPPGKRSGIPSLPSVGSKIPARP